MLASARRPRDRDQARKQKKAESHVRAVATIQIGGCATSSTRALPATVVNRQGVGTTTAAAMAAVTAVTATTYKVVRARRVINGSRNQG